MTRSARPLICIVIAALSLAASACGTSGGDVAKGDSREVPAHSTDTAVTPDPKGGSSQELPASSGSSGGTKSTSTTTTEPNSTKQPDSACQPGPGRKVQDLPNLEIAAFHASAFDLPDEKLGGTLIKGAHIPAIDLPAQRVEGGCVIYYDAPGGCIGGVQITGASIGSRSIPGASLPPVVVDGKTLFSGDSAPGGSAEGEKVEGETVERSCRVDPDPTDRSKPAISRASATRPSLSRASLSRPSMSRPPICLDVDGEQQCTESVFVDSEFVDSEFVDSVFVDSAFVDSEYLSDAPETSVLSGQSEKAYVTPAAVLFDFDMAELKPGAVPTLQAIAGQLKDLPAGARVQVDGHTDDKGTDAYNNDLSTKRAEAVAAWLRTDGGVPGDRISTKGYGESVPVAPNDTEANQAMNRRVVITVTNS